MCFERNQQWGTANTEIKDPSVENPELKVLSFKPGAGLYIAMHATPTASSCSFLPFQSIHLHFFQNLSWVFPVLAVANTSSCMDPQNKIGHPAHHYRKLMQVPPLSACGKYIESKTCVIVFLGLCSKIVDIIWVVVWAKETCGMILKWITRG